MSARKRVSESRRHLIIPDTQVAPGEPQDHMEWIAEAIKEYEPDVVIHLGDHWDLKSLSSWDGPGSLAMEGARLDDDIEAGNLALERLTNPIKHLKNTRRILLRGNHEHRMQRAINGAPKYAGTLGDHLYNDRLLGWEVVEYYCGVPGQIELDGVRVAHFFSNPNTGKPISGTIQNRLSKIGESFYQGHQQGLMQGNLQYATGKIRAGIVAGSCYLSDQSYKGQANAHWRGIMVLNEVKDGEFCEMPLTLNYLCKKYTGSNLDAYLRKKYPRMELSLKRASK